MVGVFVPRAVGGGSIARPCSICNHLQRQEIEAEIAKGVPLSRIAPNYGTNERSLRRHVTHMQTAAKQALAARVIEPGRSVLERLRAMTLVWEPPPLEPALQGLQQSRAILEAERERVSA